MHSRFQNPELFSTYLAREWASMHMHHAFKQILYKYMALKHWGGRTDRKS
jgi:hypothetical protein